MGTAKEKLVGIIIIIIGAFPLLMNIESFANSLKQYTFMTYLMAGQPVYQIILILLGVLLLYSPKPKGYPYPRGR